MNWQGRHFSIKKLYSDKTPNTAPLGENTLWDAARRAPTCG
jgi:hypothetical protein